MDTSDPHRSTMLKSLILSSINNIIGGIIITLVTLQFPPETILRLISVIGIYTLVVLIEYVYIRPIFHIRSLQWAFMYAILPLTGVLISRDIAVTPRFILFTILGWIILGTLIGYTRYMLEKRRLR